MSEEREIPPNGLTLETDGLQGLTSVPAFNVYAFILDYFPEALVTFVMLSSSFPNSSTFLTVGSVNTYRISYFKGKPTSVHFCAI